MADEDEFERGYLTGNRAAWRDLLGKAIRHLQEDADLRNIAALVSQLEDVRAALRQLCAEYGDNDWEDSLSLADVINKHLAPYLDEAADSGGDPENGGAGIERDG